MNEFPDTSCHMSVTSNIEIIQTIFCKCSPWMDTYSQWITVNINLTQNNFACSWGYMIRMIYSQIPTSLQPWHGNLIRKTPIRKIPLDTCLSPFPISPGNFIPQAIPNHANYPLENVSHQKFQDVQDGNCPGDNCPGILSRNSHIQPIEILKYILHYINWSRIPFLYPKPYFRTNLFQFRFV